MSVAGSGSGAALGELAETGWKPAGPPQPARRQKRGPLASFGLHGWLIVWAFIALFPIVWLGFTSFKPFEYVQVNYIQLIDHPTLDNYYTVLFETDFPRWFLNSIIVSALTMALGIVISASAGYAMSRFRFPGHRPLMWTFLITQMFPIAILIVPLFNIFANLNLLNNIWALPLAYMSTVVPFCTWMLKGYFDTVPIDIDEAGRVDGLSPFGTFWRLIVPLARPGLAVTAFYTFLTAWGEVAYATVFLSTPENYTLAVGMQTWVGQFKTEWNLLAAGAVIVTIPSVIVFLLVQRNLVAGLTAGGTKG